MARRPRWNHSKAFNAKVEVAAIKGKKALIDLVRESGIHPNQINQWRGQLLEGATGVFGEAPTAALKLTLDVKILHARMRELLLGRLLSGAFGRRVCCRAAEIDRSHHKTAVPLGQGEPPTLLPALNVLWVSGFTYFAIWKKFA